MQDWGPRTGAAFLSLLLHALLLTQVYRWTLLQPGAEEPLVFPVTVLVPPAPQAAAVPPAEPLPQAEAAEQRAEPEPPAEEAPEPEPELEIPLPEQQIVSAPEGGREEAPAETRFLSDRDISVEEQMVRHGEPAPGDGEPLASELADQEGESADEPVEGGGASPADVPRQMASLPGLAQLLPRPAELPGEGHGADPEPGPPEVLEEKRRARAVAWLPPSEIHGTLDYLPDVREGDITLLNTKAHLFAPFVRRVAVRVFQNMLIGLRRSLSRGVLASESVEAEAVMNQSGDMIGFRVIRRSATTSVGVDRELKEACDLGFFDRNPPPGAEARDGNFHFLLRAFVRTFPSPGGGVHIRVGLATGLL